MKKFGIVLIFIGSLWAIWAFNMKTTINTGSQFVGSIYIPDTTVNNIGLMDERRTHLMMASVLIIVGVILYGFGSITQTHDSQSKQLMTANNPVDGTSEETRKCGYCGETVRVDEITCKHCGCQLSRSVVSK